MVVNKLLTGLKQAKGNESKQIKGERFHDSETLEPAGKTQYIINFVTGCGEVYDKYTFVHVTCLQIEAWQPSLQM